MNINIEPKQIERAIAEAVINSAIGKTIDDVINGELKAMADQWNDKSPLKQAIRKEVSNIVYQLVRDEYSESIKAAVREQLTEKVLLEIVGSAMVKLFEA